jgi:hypothetical protein
MKKLLFLFASGLLSLTATAQQSALIGSWQQLDADGNGTTNVKVFMPDGKSLGQSFNSDFSASSVWFMSNYKVLNDTSYVDQEFYHSNLFYQRDYFFTFHKENDSILVTRFVDNRLNGNEVVMLERWKKMDSPMPSYTDAEWQALHQKSLKEFDRLPKEGQTVEQYAKELNDKAQDFLKANKLDRALELMHIRAELDTTNMEWQRDVYNVYASKHMAPSSAIQTVNRYIRLTEAKAPVANDTSVVSAHRLKAYLYNFRGNPAMPQMRSLISKVIEMETTAGHPFSKDYGLDYYFMGMSYLPEGNMGKLYEYCMKSLDIFEKATDVSDNQKAEVYTTAGVALMLSGQREREGIDLLKKAASLYSGELAFKITSMVYPAMFKIYQSMLEKNPKDKKLKKEVEQFMDDKMVYEVFGATDKEFNLWGEYIVLEKGGWTLENPTASGDDHYLLQKGDEYRELELKEGELLKGEAHIRPVDAATKKDIIKQWKAYKKGKKATKK